MTCTVCGASGACRCTAPGSMLAGRYRVERLLGEGARKRVLLAADTVLERQVALCLLRTPDPKEAARLRREAAITARFGDSGRVVAVHDVGEILGGPFVVTQHLAGGSLRDLLARGPLPLARAVTIARDLALALTEVGGQGLVHRDVRPDNVWLTAEGRAVLGDFGLAVFEGDPTLEPGVVAGTATYLAPEQAMGSPPDRRGDLYSLGVVLWELLVGRPPLLAPDLPTLLELQHSAGHEPPGRHRPEIPPALDALVLRLLATVPERRPAEAAVVAAELGAVLDALPHEPAVRDRSVFVGRGEELHVLRTALADAAAGHGGLVLLLGEAGIGKTRTAAELAREAAAGGALVLRGRCPDGEGAPPYWAWTQVLRTAAERVGAPALRALVGPETDLLQALLPEPGRPAVGLEGATARFRLFDAVSRLLHALAAGGPAVVVLDDVHWADLATLALLRHAGREATSSRVLLVACARELTPPDPALAAALGRLAATATRTVVLDGLPLEPAGQLVEQLAGVSPGAQAIRTLHERTDGNPLFLSELVRLLVDEHRLDEGAPLPAGAGVPSGVREVLRRRLDTVSSGCVELLGMCAVLGREVPLDLLATVAGRPAAELLPWLEEAGARRLLVALPGVPLRYRFPHALVQEVLYDALSALEQTQLHAAAGEALLHLRGDEQHERAAELAAHFVRAAALGDAPKAVHWSVRAARAAEASGGWEEALAHYERARALTEGLPPGPDLPRVEDLLLALGDAQCRAGHNELGRATFQRAADLALLHGDAELLARAALGFGAGLGGFGFAEHADGELLALLEESLAGLDPADSPLRVRVLSRLAAELYFTPFRSRRLALSLQALEMAQRLGDPAVELVALYSRTWSLLGPDGLDERRATADRVLRVAQALHDDDMVFRAHHLRLNIFLETGQREQAEAEIDSAQRLAASTRHPEHRWQVAVSAAMRALLDGEVMQADRLADAALGLGRRGHADMALVVYGAQTLVTRWAQGRMAELIEAVRSFAGRYPNAPAWRAALAFLYTDVDRPEAARAELAALAARDFTDLPRDGNFLTAAALTAMVAARLGDRPRCVQLRALLEPYADRCVVIAAGAVAFTSVDLPLGMLCRALGEPDRALEHLERAAHRHEERGARGLLVWTRLEQVTTLLTRGGPGDQRAAERYAAGAARLADTLGMTGHAAQLRAAAPAEDQPVTVLLTDVAGSTELIEQIGELRGNQLLAEHRRRAEVLAAGYGGWALKSLGDGMLLAFPDPAEALRCAADLQREAAAGGLPLRLAVHTGTVLREGESLYGRTIVLAFRIADRARAGEVLLSAATRLAVHAVPGLHVDRGRRLRLKGFTEPVLVHRLRWEEPAEEGPAGSAPPP